MEPYKPTKRERRRAIRLSLLYCVLAVSYIIYVDSGTQTHQAALYALSAYAGGTLGLYIWGATKDTDSYNRTLVKLKEA